ncbi:MAG: hypothetical protein JWN76_748 [Chitinophagaceae bacterium]|nr:hypothetical protein [Chitinophagaceae bacterium]
MLNELLKKLIKTASGRFRFYFSLAGMSVAVILILLAVQLQVNFNSLLYNKSNQDSIANFLVVSKNMQSGNTNLTEQDIAELRKQSFIQAVGLLTPANFKVSAQSVSQNFPLYTDLFLEAVPDQFLDVNNENWKWNNSTSFVPIIIPNSFLDMYNFGFAISQGTPQLTKRAITAIPIQLNFTGGLKKENYPARIIGFSDRVSSVLVPQAFMDWANQRFGSGSIKATRVIIQTKDPGSPQLVNYLKQHDLTTDTDRTRFSKYRQIVNAVVNASWISGGIMFLFALLVFTLFIQLTIASCREEIVLLVTLGAAPKQLQRFLLKRFYPVNICIVLVALMILSAGQFFLSKRLVEQSMFIDKTLSIYTIAVAIILLVLLWMVNYSSIKKALRTK